MQRVSTAFVARVSAASSTAIAKPKCRAPRDQRSGLHATREQPPRAGTPPP